MRIDAISIGKNPPNEINVIIEVPVGGEPIKYEMDKEAGTLIVDRFLYTPMHYPGNYGFVPHTLCEDGDLAGGEYNPAPTHQARATQPRWRHPRPPRAFAARPRPRRADQRLDRRGQPAPGGVARRAGG